MWKMPVGRWFETLVHWIKENLDFFLETIASGLDAVIRALEQILLLHHAPVYPAVVATLLAGLVAYLLMKKKPPSRRLVMGIAVMAVFGGLETWRYQTLESELTASEAAALADALEAYREDLREVAPSDYDRVHTVLEEAEKVAPDDRAFIRNLGRIERRLGRLDPGEFHEAAELLGDVRELIEGDGVEVEMTDELEVLLAETGDYYHSLAGIEQSERLSRRLDGIEAAEKRFSFLNRRAYEEALAYLDASIAIAEALNISESTAGEWKELRAWIVSLNPETLRLYPAIVMIVLLSGIAGLTGGAGLAVFAALGYLLIVSMGYWTATMETLALVLGSTFFALLLGVPIGIWTARSGVANQVIRPVLDIMQTMPAFVYLIPAVLFFGLGRVPGAIATLIFAMPPAVRLTSLGIRQVPREVIEAGLAFGATPRQLLFKAQLPIAMPTILAGLNQTIMLALSMVVIGGMIGAGGLGAEVLAGITQLKIDAGFESGVAVVILAIALDRMTQRLGGARFG